MCIYVAKFKEVNVCPPPEAMYFKMLTLAWAQEIREERLLNNARGKKTANKELHKTEEERHPHS